MPPILLLTVQPTAPVAAASAVATAVQALEAAVATPAQETTAGGPAGRVGTPATAPLATSPVICANSRTVLDAIVRSVRTMAPTAIDGQLISSRLTSLRLSQLSTTRTRQSSYELRSLDWTVVRTFDRNLALVGLDCARPRQPRQRRPNPDARARSFFQRSGLNLALFPSPEESPA